MGLRFAYKGMRSLPAVVLVCLTAVQLMCSCREEKKRYVPNISDNALTPTMTTYDVDALISEGGDEKQPGYTRYRLRSSSYSMYERTDSPFWFFPDSLLFEEFDRDRNVVATTRCDSAIRYTRHGLLKLMGHVVITNVNHETIYTQYLEYNENEVRNRSSYYEKGTIRTDSFIRVITPERVLEGYGLESNSHFTDYEIKSLSGMFPRPARSGETGGQAPGQPSERPARERRGTPPPPRPSSGEALFFPQ